MSYSLKSKQVHVWVRIQCKPPWGLSVDFYNSNTERADRSHCNLKHSFTGSNWRKCISLIRVSRLMRRLRLKNKVRDAEQSFGLVTFELLTLTESINAFRSTNSFIPWLKKIIWVIGVLRRTVVNGSKMVQTIFLIHSYIQITYIRSDEGLTLQTSASLSLHGANLTHINLFDTKS